MISTLIGKDLRLYVRNRLYSFLTVLGLVAYIAIYFLAPASSDDSFGLGMVVEAPQDHPLVQRLMQTIEDVQLVDSRQTLLSLLTDEKLFAGMVLTAEDVTKIEQGQPTKLELLIAPGAPEYLREAMADLMGIAMNDLSSASGGRLHRIEETSEVLGPDLVGKTLSMRQRMVPMLAFFVLIIEALGMAALINQEVVTETARALLVTPLRTSQFMTAKAFMSVGLATIQVLILLLITGQITKAPLQILVLVLLGGLLMTGVAFLIAAIARDYMGVFAWGFVFIIPLTLPTLSVVFPGLANAWMEWIPSFFLVDGLHRAVNFQVAWSDLTSDLLGLLATGLVLLALGGGLLRRRFQ